MTGFSHVADMTCCELKEFFMTFCQSLEDGTDAERIAMGRTVQVLKYGYDKFRKNYQHLKPLSEIEDLGDFGRTWNEDVHGQGVVCEVEEK